MANNWIGVSPLSGHGDGSITITVGQYKALTARTGSITVCTDDVECAVTVTQNAYTEPTLIFSSPTSLLFDSSGGTRSIQITAYDDWEWMNYPFYMDVSVESGTSGVYDIDVTVPQNTELIVHQEDLAIRCGDEVLYIPFTQYAGQTVVPTGLTIDSISWVTDIPASGGTASSANCTYVATVHYSDSSTLDVSNLVNMSGTLNVSASTSTERHSVGLLTLNASIYGQSAQTSVTVYQAAVEHGTITTSSPNVVASASQNWRVTLICDTENMVSASATYSSAEGTFVTYGQPVTIDSDNKIRIVVDGTTTRVTDDYLAVFYVRGTDHYGSTASVRIYIRRYPYP